MFEHFTDRYFLVARCRDLYADEEPFHIREDV